ncbi:hypothetical protein [Thermohalobacter berrensis]|uniref:Uncharacterized protein n=1 Tax=Thermohalobacter berrensis TaxID=99594 RepID=A0A419T9M0_9FIRM|nr:hypothetical protein [Thermohalobacter berrensis]RKD34168.1 hypothetical protein BET03_07715 [Thermohalobacter berrensis]
MDNVLTNELFYKSLLKVFVEIFKMAWQLDVFKSAIIGIPVSIVTYRIVGFVFSWGRYNGIWFGRVGGKLIYYCINSILIWLIMKVV